MQLPDARASMRRRHGDAARARTQCTEHPRPRERGGARAGCASWLPRAGKRTSRPSNRYISSPNFRRIFLLLIPAVRKTSSPPPSPSSSLASLPSSPGPHQPPPLRLLP